MIRIRLRQILWDKEITAISVHEATGISQSILSDIVRGKRTNVGLDIINKLCNFLGCGLHELLEYKKD
ncbi:MAG: helix-turn-helix transcriptional regulator [Candidatus Gastranaerophilales bacterium]